MSIANSGAITIGGTVTANSFAGDGSSLTGIPIANKAFITWNTSTNTIHSSSNVSSVSSHGSGDETVNFTSAFSDSDYAVVGSWGSNGVDAAVCTVGIRLGSISGSPTNKTTSACRIIGGGKYGYANSKDTSHACLAFYR
jgi:hypothetical protein